MLDVPEAQSSLPRGGGYRTYAVRVPASGVLYVPRTVAPQVGARLTWEETGLPGTLLAGFFVVYLCADTLIACLMRSHLQRSLGPLYIHHTIVVVGVVCHTSISPTLTLTQNPNPSPSPNRARARTEPES